MKSTAVLTFEMDDMTLAAKQLADQVKSTLKLCKKTFGVIYADSELDHKALMAALKEELPIEFIGCTTVAVLDGKQGFLEMCTSLVVITGDDISFSITHSEPITASNAYDVIRKAYHKCAEAINNDVKLIFALPPYNLDIMLDEFPEILSEVSGGKPVYGGLPSFNESDDSIATMDSFGVYDNRMILLVMGGNVKPIFSVGSVVENLTRKKAVVTKSDKNIVYSVGDMPFVEYCNTLGLSMMNLNESRTLPFVSTPMVIETAGIPDDDGVPVIRAIHAVDKEDGSCIAICKVPQDSLLSIASLKKSDIEASSAKGIEDLLKQIGDNSIDGYEYSTIFCTSCIGRFLIMTPDNDAEGNIVMNATPDHIQVTGYYGYGEISPTSIREGKAMNRAHNHSIVMLAI